MPRLLQGRNRPSTSASASTPSRSATSNRGSGSATDLPPIEPPSHPINETGKRALAEISSNRETRKYEAHLAKSAGYLKDSVGIIQDALYTRRNQLKGLVEKRRANGATERNDLELQLDGYTSRLTTEVDELTESSEAALRQVIDYRAELEDEKQVLDTVLEQVRGQRPRPEPQPQKRERERKRKVAKRRAADSEDDDFDEDDKVQEEDEEEDAPDVADVPPLVSVRELLKTARRSKASEYEALSAYQRYGKDNEYISFKKTWHDAQHPEDQVPLPDASTWFDQHGRPTTGAAAEEEDDDLVVEREIIDLKCPLSLQVLKEPYSNHKCTHTFEKSAIMDYLQTSGGTAQCPVCEEELTVMDLYFDKLVLRKIKRAEEAARRDVDGTSDAEAHSGADESMIIQRTNNVKKERARSRQNVEDVEDD
ncbi:zinc-finger of the MIZ type in Nse subunit-domain-containing protein [Podospora didyma]|uniref:Zinc-finger of the MIZ type in Nse subunit-domain-containing protein n=1 Tax=Podospora didyma TaxID=330526 RepID=A0AAE0TVT7_9PEZI|nr:zinc-finger of the MIZ type in Nse subunit-domain-containing protein [Podospora didyma]